MGLWEAIYDSDDFPDVLQVLEYHVRSTCMLVAFCNMAAWSEHINSIL